MNQDHLNDYCGSPTYQIPQNTTHFTERCCFTSSLKENGGAPTTHGKRDSGPMVKHAVYFVIHPLAWHQQP